MPRQANPFALIKRLWPGVVLYREQRQIIESLWNNVETIVPAANELGKDFTAGLGVVVFFLTRYPCRIVTTSATDSHLDILWGEIERFVHNSKEPLTSDKGGPLIMNHHHIRRNFKGRLDSISFIKGIVTRPSRGEAMQGAHAGDDPFTVLEKLERGLSSSDGTPKTMMVGDESSGLDPVVFQMADSWADRRFYFGNTWNCSNYFRQSVDGDPAKNDPGGDIPDPNNLGKFYRKVIHLDCEVSPNIRYARKQISLGMKPDDTVLIPGVKTWSKLQEDLAKLDPIQKTVKLHAKFYKGTELYLFPEDKLWAAIKFAETLKGQSRISKALGVDSAEGGDNSSFTETDMKGVVDQLSMKTHDTALITDEASRRIKSSKLDPENVLFDRGGGGKQHVDHMRRRGFNVRSIGFGEAVTDPHKNYKTSTIKPPVGTRVTNTEHGYVFKNRRAEMYGLASVLVCSGQFGIPAKFTELIRQLKVIPKLYDGEGRLYLPPKDKPHPNYTGQTLKQLLGCSPDEADSFVLAIYAMLRKPVKVVVGAAG